MKIRISSNLVSTNKNKTAKFSIALWLQIDELSLSGSKLLFCVRQNTAKAAAVLEPLAK